jgi:hypothetical protein
VINADKPTTWPENIRASVDQYNRWFLEFAPKAFRAERARAIQPVDQAFRASSNLTILTPDVLRRNPGIVETLRMCCCPPIARERLSGLAGVNLSFVKTLEGGSLPPRMMALDLTTNLGKVLTVLRQLLDEDLFPWLKGGQQPTDEERKSAELVIGDRLCESRADPIIRNAQEERQLGIIRQYLVAKGYVEQRTVGAANLMPPGTFAFRVNVPVASGTGTINVSIDAAIQPRNLRPSGWPILIECKAAGDFTNVNKRRKEEGQKGRQLRAELGGNCFYLLFLCGYFGDQYLQYEAAENFDWIWEHRLQDLDQLGL